MSSVRNPVGPQPPSVYWRRRLFALLGLVAIIVVIVLIVTSLQGGGGGPTPSPTPSGTTSTAPQGSGDDEDACDPGAITLEPITDATHYAAGVTPLVSMRITNTGSSACTLDVGTAQQEYVIVSGSDPIWNSRDCQTDAEAFDLVLEPNDPVTTNPFPWDRTRSSTSTCASARPEVIAAGSTYRLSVKLGDLTSAGDAAFILD
jgi:hypothetical protein